MNVYLAVDPGADRGAAVFSERGELLRTCLGNPPLAWHGAPVAVIIEKPFVYPSSKSKGSPNDLITLALLVGREIERWEPRGSKIILVTPVQWKGQLSKDTSHARLWASLNDREKEIVHQAGKGVAPSKRHNFLDACALGKWAFLEKKFPV